MRSVEQLAKDRDRLKQYDKIKPVLDAFQSYVALNGGATIDGWAKAHKEIINALSTDAAKIIVSALKSEIKKLNETES